VDEKSEADERQVRRTLSENDRLKHKHRLHKRRQRLLPALAMQPLIQAKPDSSLVSPVSTSCTHLPYLSHILTVKMYG